MQALVKYQKGPGFMEVREVLEPVISEDEVLIRVRAAGICGTDLHIQRDEWIYYPPVILGHEFSGEVAAVGSRVTDFAVGDRVVSEVHTGYCGKCSFCLKGQRHFCPSKLAIGWGIDGAMAEYIRMPESLLHRIPEGVNFEEAALAEPAAVATYAVIERAGVEVGDVVVVLGPGPVGLLAAQVARAAGAGTVIVAGTSADAEYRLKIAGEAGADHVVNVQETDLAGMVRDLTDGRGADLVVEASGSERGIVQALELARRDGRVSAIGLPGQETIAVPWTKTVISALRVDFSFSSKASSWEKVLQLMKSGRLNVSPMISHRAPLSDWEPVFADLSRGRGIKALLVP